VYDARQSCPRYHPLSASSPGDHRDANASKPLFKSHLIEGILLRDLTTPNKYTVQWGASHVLQSAHNEAGRGMELSELISYKG